MTRPFLKGTAFGAVAMFVLIWVFPELAPTARETAERGGDSLPTLDRMRARGVARIGFANEAPYAYLDPESGRLDGEAPEIARVILGRFGGWLDRA